MSPLKNSMQTVLGAFRRSGARGRARQLELQGLVGDLNRLELAAASQDRLERNLTLLRETLYAHGAPRLESGELFFGSKCAHNDVAAVDQVKAQAGGVATIFLGDLRIATNVVTNDGSRAIGTRLAAGPVHDAVLGAARSFRGETEILGQAYYAIYEPVLVAGRAVGVLFVGVPKAAPAPLANAPSSGARDRGGHSVEQVVLKLQELVSETRENDLVALRDRQAATDQRLRQEASRQLIEVEQQRVVESLSVALSRLAKGDLSCGFAEDLPVGYRQLQTDFEAAQAALRTALGAIAQGAEVVDGAAAEITHAADDLSRRTEQQAASLEQTAAALDQVTATVKLSAQGARQAHQAAIAAKADAVASGEVMSDAIAAMGEIQQGSHKVSQIIGTIDEIAFQTNLLALNAGVEAARAGDAGRGFAVVAAEVRALAQRSALAAKEIKTLIAASTEEVKRGVSLVGDTGRALTGIAGKVADIDTLVATITMSAQEQSSALSEVNKAVNQMDQMTQQNAAMVEQTTAASHSLRQEAGALVEAVSGFRIGRDQGAGASATAISAPPALRLVSQREVHDSAAELRSHVRFTRVCVSPREH